MHARSLDNGAHYSGFYSRIGCRSFSNFCVHQIMRALMSAHQFHLILATPIWCSAVHTITCFYSQKCMVAPPPPPAYAVHNYIYIYICRKLFRHLQYSHLVSMHWHLCYWIAVKEFKIDYHNGETILLTRYTHIMVSLNLNAKPKTANLKSYTHYGKLNSSSLTATQ